ncbi:MAG: hypothetical protein S4CHLAM37_01930 [Chlamydiia bacterium]|nr:hypothetical protein [Chlamydiia bacterium]
MFEVVASRHNFFGGKSCQDRLIVTDGKSGLGVGEKADEVAKIVKALFRLPVNKRAAFLDLKSLNVKTADMFPKLKAACLRGGVMIKDATSKASCSHFTLSYEGTKPTEKKIEEGVTLSRSASLELKKGDNKGRYTLTIEVSGDQQILKKSMKMNDILYVFAHYLAKLGDCSEKSLQAAFDRYMDGYSCEASGFLIRAEPSKGAITQLCFRKEKAVWRTFDSTSDTPCAKSANKETKKTPPRRSLRNASHKAPAT